MFNCHNLNKGQLAYMGQNSVQGEQLEGDGKKQPLRSGHGVITTLFRGRTPPQKNPYAGVQQGHGVICEQFSLYSCVQAL